MALPPNFSYVFKRLVAGSGHPGRGQLLSSALNSLNKDGIQSIVSLTEVPLEFAPIREFEMDYLHVPIDDFTAPTQGQIDEVIEFLTRQCEQERGSVIHCQAGIGRTGTMLACFLVAQGMDAAEAIQRVRQMRPGSLEVYTQEYAVYQYAKRLKKKKNE